MIGDETVPMAGPPRLWGGDLVAFSEPESAGQQSKSGREGDARGAKRTGLQISWQLPSDVAGHLEWLVSVSLVHWRSSREVG